MQATTGFAKKRATRECTMPSTHSRGPREPSWRAGSARAASVTGAESASRSGASITRSMCWPMCALNSTWP